MKKAIGTPSGFSLQSKQQRGFTLVELLVVVAIFLVLTALWFFRPDPNRELVVRNAALEMEVHMREAQAAALGTRSVDGDFVGTIGVGFIARTPGDAQRSFVVFVDNPDGDEHQYVFSATGDNPDILLAEHELPDFVEIHRIRKFGGGSGPSELLPEGNDHGVSVLFRRPSTDALVVYERTDGSDAGVYAWGGVEIVLRNTRHADIMQTVRVYNTGAIEIIDGDAIALGETGPDSSPLATGPGASGGAGASGEAPYNPAAEGGGGSGAPSGGDNGGASSGGGAPGGTVSSGMCQIRIFPEANYGGTPTTLSGSTVGGVGMYDMRLYGSLAVAEGSDPFLICNPAHHSNETQCDTIASGQSIPNIAAHFGNTYESPSGSAGRTAFGCPANSCTYTGVYEVSSSGHNIQSNMSCSRSFSCGGPGEPACGSGPISGGGGSTVSGPGGGSSPGSFTFPPISGGSDGSGGLGGLFGGGSGGGSSSGGGSTGTGGIPPSGGSSGDGGAGGGFPLTGGSSGTGGTPPSGGSDSGSPTGDGTFSEGSTSGTGGTPPSGGTGSTPSGGSGYRCDATLFSEDNYAGTSQNVGILAANTQRTVVGVISMNTVTTNFRSARFAGDLEWLMCAPDNTCSTIRPGDQITGLLPGVANASQGRWFGCPRQACTFSSSGGSVSMSCSEGTTISI